MAKYLYEAHIYKDLLRRYYEGLVDRSHLDTRMRTLKLGVMKTPIGRGVWHQWKGNRSEEFISWFENEIYPDADGQVDEDIFNKESSKLNVKRD